MTRTQAWDAVHQLLNHRGVIDDLPAPGHPPEATEIQRLLRCLAEFPLPLDAIAMIGRVAALAYARGCKEADVEETPATIYQWVVDTFGPADPLLPTTALRLLEEAAELCEAAGASWEEICFRVKDASVRSLNDNPHRSFAMAPPRDPDKIHEEGADVYILLCAVGGVYGFDPARASVRKMRINRHERDWVQHGDGTGHHVKATDKDHDEDQAKEAPAAP